MESNYKLYHLVKPSEHGPSDHQDKMVTEIYLTRFAHLIVVVVVLNSCFNAVALDAILPRGAFLSNYEVAFHVAVMSVIELIVCGLFSSKVTERCSYGVLVGCS